MSNRSNSEEVNLTGQVAIVTGGGRGIGRSIALALGGAGAKVAVIARTTEEVADSIRPSRSTVRLLSIRAGRSG